jgi:hypothetical protein
MTARKAAGFARQIIQTRIDICPEKFTRDRARHHTHAAKKRDAK